MRNQIKDIQEHKGDNSALINLDSSNREGSHWTCYFHKAGGPVEYFDSYGMPPPQEFYHRFAPDFKIIFNSSQLQMLGTDTCGYFCVEYIRNRTKNIPMYNILYRFTQHPTLRNEQSASRHL